MRQIIDLQDRLFGNSIQDINFDPQSRDEIPQLLRGLQYIFVTPPIRTKVEAILRKVIPEETSLNSGRPGMSIWQILVLGTLRLNCNWDWDKVHEIANQHRTVRIMIGHDFDDFKRYGLQTIRDNVALMTKEILDEVSVVVVKTGHDLIGKKSSVLNGRCDSYVCETDVHYPTDINLLFDAIRKIFGLLSVICNTFGITEWRQHKHNLKKVKALFSIARKLRHSNSKNEEKKAERAQLIVEAYQIYIDVVGDYVRQAEKTLELIRSLGASSVTLVQIMEIEYFIGHADRQIDQIQRRAIEDEIIPHSEKVFSLFEEHTEWICKGKAGVPVELGLRVCVLEDQYGFILHHKVMEKETDDKVALEMVKATQVNFENLKSCSFDKGFYTPDNKKKLAELLEASILPQKGKLSEKQTEEEHSEVFLVLGTRKK